MSSKDLKGKRKFGIVAALSAGVLIGFADLVYALLINVPDFHWPHQTLNPLAAASIFAFHMILFPWLIAFFVGNRLKLNLPALALSLYLGVGVYHVFCWVTHAFDTALPFGKSLALVYSFGTPSVGVIGWAIVAASAGAAYILLDRKFSEDQLLRVGGGIFLVAPWVAGLVAMIIWMVNFFSNPPIGFQQESFGILSAAAFVLYLAGGVALFLSRNFSRPTLPLAVVLTLVAVARYWGPDLSEKLFMEKTDQVTKMVVLITHENISPALLSQYRAEGLELPGFDAMANNGVTFKNAIAPDCRAAPSIATILTGYPPEAHRLRSANDALVDKMPSLAERMASNGYITAAIGDGPRLADEQGFDHGFMIYQMRPEYSRFFGEKVFNKFKNKSAEPEAIFNQARQLLDRYSARGIFLWIHLRQPTAPEVDQVDDKTAKIVDALFPADASRPVDTARAAAYFQKASETLRDTDQFLKELGGRDDFAESLIIYAGANGVEFVGPGAEPTVGTFPSGDQLSTPLIIKLPGCNTPKEYESFVSVSGIKPMVEDIAIGGGVWNIFVGPPLTAMVTEDGRQKVAGTPVYFDCSIPMASFEGVIFHDKYKFLFRPSTNSGALYDLSVGEKAAGDISRKNPAFVSMGAELLRYRIDGLGPVKQKYGAETRAMMSTCRRETLIDLGYLH